MSAENHVFQTAKRFPRIPDRSEFPPEERAAYDFEKLRVEEFASGRYSAELVDGRPYGVPHMEALLVSPPLAAALSGPGGMGEAVLKTQDAPGSYTSADHEWIDVIHAFDSGYWALVAGHTPSAIAAGIRVEALEAVANGHEEALNDDERQVIEFIRAVRDGGVTDEMWFAMRDRLGSDRGVVDYIGHILLLLFHHRFCWAVGAPEMTREAWWRLIGEFKNGTRTAAGERARLAGLREEWGAGRRELVERLRTEAASGQD